MERLLSQETFDLDYGELEQILRGAHYDPVGAEGAARSWKHSVHRDVLTVRDGIGKPMYSRYVRKAAEHLCKVHEKGGFDVTTDFG